MKKLRFITLLAFVMTAFAISASAQLTGTKNVPGDYADLAAAVADLNTQGVGAGGVTINLVAGNPQTAPAGGYVIGGTGSLVLTSASAVNPIVFQGNGNTITASAALTAGNLNDAIFKLVGADWTTISGFSMTENAANTTTTAASNNMTEWGVALLYVTATDGANSVTITGNTIDLNRTYQNTFGIYANATHTATAVTTSASATGAAGGNSGLTITANNVTDVNNGIVVIGPTAAADNNDGITIGGSAPNANTITNFGTTGTFSAYANVSGTVNGILVRNSKNFNVSFNSITSSAGGVTAGTLNGIQQPAASVSQTGTFTNNIINNTISLQSGLAAGAVNGINVPSGSGSLTSILNINNNNFTQLNHSVAASGTIQGIVNVGSSTVGPLTHSISGNTFTNLTTNTTGSFTFISNSWARPTNGVANVNNNSIVTGFNKTGAGGTVTLYTSNSTSGATIQEINNNNNFSNITVTGATVLQGWRSTDGGSPIKTATGNTFSNWTGGTSQLTGLAVSFSGSATVSNNTVSNFNCACTIVGIETSSGTQTITRNKVYDLSSSATAPLVSGALISGGTTVNFQNNLIGNLFAPSASAADAIRGINITSTTATSTLNVSFNTIYLNAASAGANFGTTGLFHTTNATATTAALVLRNNIIVNTSTAAGTGLTVAYRRSSTTLTNYGSASNNNLFYAGTPSAANLIFNDGTNSDQTLATYKTRVASRDSASITENPTFLSTTGANANFLHISLVTPTQIESGGIAIAGITDDFDGDTRNATTPDIGADEFTGIPLDLNGPTIAYTNLLNTSSTGDRVLNITVIDPSGVPTSGIGLPIIYYRKNGGVYASTQCSFVSGNSYSCSLIAAAVGGVATNDTIDYYVAAQDTANNVSVNPSAGAAGLTANPPAASTPPTTPNQYKIVAAINGSFNVGTGETYTSLTNAGGIFEFINNNDVTGNITINLTTDLTGETGTVALNEYSSGFSVTIKPSSGPRLISGSNATALIKLNGADNVTINGNVAGALVGGLPGLRELTIQNTGAGAIIWIATNATSGATNNTIKNINMIGAGAGTGQGIIAGSGTTVGNAAENGRPNSNNTIRNNTAKGVQNAVFASGDAVTLDQNWVIAENDFGSTVTAEKLSFRGILVANAQNPNINQNRISGVNSTTTTSATMSGIMVSGVIVGGQIVRNEIKDIRQNNTTGWGSNGIFLSSSSTAANLLIANNFISDIASQGFNGFDQSDNGYGIMVNTGGGYGIYHNTVVMNANQVATTGHSSCLNIETGLPAGSVAVANNIFVNNQTVGNRYGVIDQNTNGATYSALSNNDYFSSTGSFFGRLNSVNYSTLVTWQGATGADLNSLDVDPQFVSATNFHLLATSPVRNVGNPIPAVTDDFDGQARPNPFDSLVVQVDMGGDEFYTTTAAPAEISGRVVTAEGNGIVNAAVIVSGGNLSQPIVVKTGSFGKFTVEGLATGQTYIVTVQSKRYTFEQPSRVVSLDANVSDLEFISSNSR